MHHIFTIMAAFGQKYIHYFIKKIMGGPCVGKKIMPISIMRMWSDQSNSYDEPIGYRIIGVELGDQNKVSRIHVWEIQRKPKEQEAFSGGVLSPPWSSVNNCTQLKL